MQNSIINDQMYRYNILYTYMTIVFYDNGWN